MRVLGRGVTSLIDRNNTFKIDVRLVLEANEDYNHNEIIETIKNDMLLMDAMSAIAVEAAKSTASVDINISDVKLKNLIKDNILKAYHDLDGMVTFETTKTGHTYVKFAVKLKMN